MDETECLICLEDLDSKDKAVLSCKHIMHYNCLKAWINKKQSVSRLCPICNNRGEIINIIEAKPVIIKNNKIVKYDDYDIKPFTFCCNIL
jgi:hypothetical protein